MQQHTTPHHPAAALFRPPRCFKKAKGLSRRQARRLAQSSGKSCESFQPIYRVHKSETTELAPFICNCKMAEDSDSSEKVESDDETEETSGVDMKMMDARLSQMRRAKDQRAGQSKLKAKYQVL